MDEITNKLLMQKAGMLLARRAYSRGELKNRLARIAEEFPLEPILDRLQQLNLLNDADYAYNFALCRIKQQGWGPAKVQRSLLRRHVDRLTVECALERVRSELGNEYALASYVQEHCRRRGLPADLKSLRKLILHLGQRGFEQEIIFDVVRPMVSASLWQRFETGERID
jgi:regulatory protein